jgi:hypothetical protein
MSKKDAIKLLIKFIKTIKKLDDLQIYRLILLLIDIATFLTTKPENSIEEYL